MGRGRGRGRAQDGGNIVIVYWNFHITIDESCSLKGTSVTWDGYQTLASCKTYTKWSRGRMPNNRKCTLWLAGMRTCKSKQRRSNKGTCCADRTTTRAVFASQLTILLLHLHPHLTSPSSLSIASLTQPNFNNLVRYPRHLYFPRKIRFLFSSIDVYRIIWLSVLLN